MQGLYGNAERVNRSAFAISTYVPIQRDSPASFFQEPGSPADEP